MSSAPDSTEHADSPSAAALTLDKQAGTPVDVNGNGLVDAGDTIPYTFLVTNTGVVTLTGIAVNDAEGRRRHLPVHDPAAGPERRPARRRYTITQADVDAGSVDNTATASGTPRPARR